MKVSTTSMSDRTVVIRDIDGNGDELQGEYKRFHRSGWAFAMRALREALRDGNQEQEEENQRRLGVVYIDYYVDRSFLWKRDELVDAGRLPRTRLLGGNKERWAGFVHHTFGDVDQQQENGCRKLAENDLFRESLRNCAALFVFSESNRTDWLRALREIDRQADFDVRTRVYTVTHPTEHVKYSWLMFNLGEFVNNPERSLVQVGAWLRDPYTIYDLNVDRGINVRDSLGRLVRALPLRRAALRGRQMDAYFPPRNTEEWASRAKTQCARLFWEGAFHDREGQGGRVAAGAWEPRAMNYVLAVPDYHDTGYKFANDVIDFCAESTSSVVQLPELSDKKYDILLSRNAVFLRLLDASAVNAVLECIIRNTPVFVNRLPAVIEILGEGYPGLYTNVEDALARVTELDAYARAHEYLRDMNKTRFTAPYFVESVRRGLLDATRRRR